MPGVLILVPTELELCRLTHRHGDAILAREAAMAVCGFGPIAAGIQTTLLLRQHKPELVVLIGIAGALSDHLAVGTAISFSRIACYGIGAGSGSEFRTAGELGWSQIQGETPGQGSGDIIEIATSGQLIENDSSEDKAMKTAPTLLTVCSASANVDDVVQRLKKFPEAVAEDMEGYAVAMACRACNVPLAVIRGLSNRAGDRDKTHWDIDGAIDSAAELLLQGSFL